MTTINSLVPCVQSIKSTTQRPYAESKIGKVIVRSLFDTGADISCLKTETYKRANLSIDVKSDLNRRFKAAGGNNLQISGKVMLPIEIDNKKVEHPFFLIDNHNEQCILGIDFITKHQLSYCPQTRTFFWPGDK